MVDRNVLGAELEPCGTDPLTGFYRDGCCTSGPDDHGSHTICAVVTAEFLEHQRRIGNDLTTPMPRYGFPGLVPGDRWCVTAANWLRAHNDGAAAHVVLASTHEMALQIVPLSALGSMPWTCLPARAVSRREASSNGGAIGSARSYSSLVNNWRPRIQARRPEKANRTALQGCAVSTPRSRAR